jgi:hypothetical protein
VNSEETAMNQLNRRNFLSLLARITSSACAALPFVGPHVSSLRAQTQDYKKSPTLGLSCWLDVCAPFIVEDNEHGIHSEIVLTSDTFIGAQGYKDGADATEYEIYLYDAEGKPVTKDGLTRRLFVPAMQTTVITARDLIGEQKSFWGGMKIRLRPKGREPMHASDLFSSAFVRWRTDSSFDNVHANPDPLEWQKAEGFYYSMPFPSLAEYECAFSLFNPNDQESKGNVTLYDPQGRKLASLPYELKPHASLLLSLNEGAFTDKVVQAFRNSDKDVAKTKTVRQHADTKSKSGTLAVTNEQNSVKSFGYLLIKRAGQERFSIDHPIHQNLFKPLPAVVVAPFASDGSFKGKNVLYAPLLFRAKQIGGITLETLFHFSTGAVLEEALWLNPFVTDAEGNVVWLAAKDAKLLTQLPAAQIERGVIRLPAQQSCVLDLTKLSFKENSSGGLSLVIAPDSTHTLMKVEVRVPEWNAHAFTHFRPGIRAARSYQKPKQRGGLATDYITSGARLVQQRGKQLFDEIIAVMNIDDQGLEGQPVLEAFGKKGLLTRIRLGSAPGFACRHYTLSEVLGVKTIPEDMMSLRLIDEQATLLMSILHIDYGRRDIALDHGSDRFSTYTDYTCNLSA